MTPADLVITKTGARFQGRRLSCSIGRGGITHDKREGDAATPAGIHRIVGAGYRRDRLADPFGGNRGPFTMGTIGPGDIWSDDQSDPDYNHGLRAANHPYSHEKLFRGDRLYDLILITDWNWPDAIPGKGSAIFVHRWRKPRHPTEGCIAFDLADLLWITRNLTARSRLIVG
ncbi:MAG: L,D-transpeptidase family protein [Marinibacterium sp.]